MDQQLEYRRFGNTDMEVSVLGFGGAEIGMPSQSPGDRDVNRLLNTVLEHGVNVIDTAASYNNSEELIGESISHRRQEYYLFSKLGESSPIGLDYPDWDARIVRPSVEQSLKKLQTDYLDLILIHSCSEAILRHGDLIDAVERVKKAGLVRYIGYSGDSTDALYAIKTGRFDALQTSLNIADQEALHLTLNEAQARNMGVISKRPVTNAVWVRRGQENAPEPYVERLDKLDYDFLDEDAGTIVEQSLRFVISQPQVHTAIVGTTKIPHFLDNVRYAMRGKLPDEEVRAIRSRWDKVKEPAWAGLL